MPDELTAQLAVQGLLLLMTGVLSGLGYLLIRLGKKLVSHLEDLIAVPQRVTRVEDIVLGHGLRLDAHEGLLEEHGDRLTEAETRLEERR